MRRDAHPRRGRAGLPPRRLQRGLQHVPHGRRLQARRDREGLQTHGHVPASRRPRNSEMPRLPQVARIQEDDDAVRGLPPRPAHRGVGGGLRALPHTAELHRPNGAARRSPAHAFPPHRCARHSRLRGVSRSGGAGAAPVREHARGLPSVPPPAVPGDHRPESRRRRLLHGLQPVPHADVVPKRAVHAARRALLPDLLRRAQRAVGLVQHLPQRPIELLDLQLPRLPPRPRHVVAAPRCSRVLLQQQRLLRLPPTGRAGD